MATVDDPEHRLDTEVRNVICRRLVKAASTSAAVRTNAMTE
jgi:hypothetical protein